MANRKGLRLRRPWGAHMTANRFKERRDPKRLRDFFKLMKEAPVIGKSRPEKLDVGYFILTPDGFDMHIYESFPLI